MKVKTGYSKSVFAHGKCRIIDQYRNNYIISPITQITRPDGTEYCVSGGLFKVNKDEVSNIKEEEI